MYLWRVVAQELGDWCHVSTTRDYETVSRRTNTEGLSFLTITLPTFAKDFDEALDLGSVGHAHFGGFRRMGGLPVFLRGFLDLVFDRSTGELLSEPDKTAVFAIRQLTRLFSKINLDCSDERTRKAFESYWTIEDELEELEISEEDLLDFRRISRVLFGNVLHGMDFLHATGGLVPKHGPGATADKLLGNQKFRQTVWHRRLELGGLVSTDFLLPNARYHSELEGVKFVEPGDERPVRVISVPKTLKTPRIIAIEPTCMQYAQQAIAEPLYALLAQDKILGDMINLFDQDPNRELARRGSFDATLATLDLSEASDRVSNQLVEILTHGYTNFSDAVQACRSLTADVPGYGVRRLTKFASMGSALCFPIEAMVFLTIVFVGIERAQGSRIRAESVRRMHGKVRVFGDDIIVPSDYALSVAEALESFGLKVNSHKSFWSGNFRESCGKEYFRGHDVSIVKAKRLIPTSRRDVDEVVSTVKLRNRFFSFGLFKTCEYLDRILFSVLKHYPEVEETSPILGRLTLSPPSGDGWDPKLHRPVVKGWIVTSRIPNNPLDGSAALLKFFLKRGGLPTADVKHLERSGRPLAVDIKLANGPIR